MRRYAITLALAVAAMMFGPQAFAANVTLVAPDQVTPIGSNSQNPLFVTGGGGGGSGYTGATATAPGTSGATATPVQGVSGGVPLIVQWSGQSVSVGNFPATQAVNQTQINGTAVATGTGASNAGTQRTVLSSDSVVGIGGTLPAFAATPTFNLGTLNGAALDTSVQQVKTALGSPFQAGGSIANTSFGISGTLPAFAATPTFNLGTLNGAATAVNQVLPYGSVAPGSPGSYSVTTGGVYNSTPPTLTNGQQVASQFDASGNQKVNVAVSLPAGSNSIGVIGNTAFGISGTLPAFAATPTFKIDQTTPGTTNGVVVNSSALPTGGSTSANQLLPFGPVAPGAAAANSTLGGGVYNSTPPTLATGQQSAVQLNASGALKTDGSASTQPISVPNVQNAIGATAGNALTVQGATSGVPMPTAGGGVYNSTPPTLTNGQQSTVQLDPSGNQKTSIWTGTTALSINGNGQVASYIAAVPNSGGVTAISRLPSSAATTNATSVKTAAGRVYKIRAYNTTGSPIRLKLYNKATAPVPGTDTPFDVFLLSSGNNSFDVSDIGWYFSTGIGYALVTGAPDSDATAVTAGAVTDLSIGYQ